MASGVTAQRALALVDALCSVTGDRRPGSTGNDEAVTLVAGAFAAAGWDVSTPEFPCLDWETDGAEVSIGVEAVSVTPSPYGLGGHTSGVIRVASSVADLERPDLAGSVLVVEGDLAREPLTPKAFPFYGSEEHTAIIEALESSGAVAVIAVTGKYPALCGALDPYPWIEDGDFTIPAASIRPSDAGPLLAGAGTEATVDIRSRRKPSRARNVIARRGPGGRRITVCAHIDTKPGTPGAVDNATGVVVLMLLAELLDAADLPIGVELLAVNGEDHFAGPGEVAWLADNESSLDDIAVFINIDGAGYRRGSTAYSFYNIDEAEAAHMGSMFAEHVSLVPGPPWYQSDHAIFAMQGRPALAFTTEHVEEMLEELFHSPSDTVAQVDADLVVDLARAISALVRSGLRSSG